MTYTIYKISNPNTDKIYIGSTKQPLDVRKSKHFNHFRTFNQGLMTRYCSAYELLQGNPIFEQIEIIDTEDKKQALERERYYIELYRNICVNRHKPIRTNIEKVQYYRQRANQFYINNRLSYPCNCGGHCSQANKLYHLKTKRHKKYEFNKKLYENRPIFELIKDF